MMKKSLTRLATAFTLSLGLIAAAATPSFAADYPTRPVRLVVPFGAGGASDQLARMLGLKLADRLGQPVIIDNKPGAGTTLGIMAVKNAEPDGYTLLLGGTSGVVNQALDKTVAFNASKDFAGVSIVGEIPYILLVNAQVPAKTFQEFAALLKGAPGKYNYASGGVGSSNHFAMELLLTMMGAQAVHVPYNSSATSIGSVAAGETQFTFDTPITAKPQIAGNKVRALATSTAARTRSLPDVPPAGESGVPGYEVTGYFSIVAPAKTPRDVVARLNKEIIAVMSEPEMSSKLLALGLDSKTSTPEAADQRTAAELARWSKLAQDLKLQKN